MTSSNPCVFSMGEFITQAKFCRLQTFLNTNNNSKKISQSDIEKLIRCNNPTYGYLMVKPLEKTETTTPSGVYASGFNTSGSYQINSSGSVVSFPSTPGSQIATSSNQILPSYILFTSSGSLTVPNLGSGQYLNVILVGGGGGGGGGGGKLLDSSTAGGGGGGGGAGYSTQGTITSYGTFTITVGQGGNGGGGYSGANGSSGYSGVNSSISGPNSFSLTAKGGSGGGYGYMKQGRQDNWGGNGGPGGNGGGGQGSGGGYTVGSGAPGQTITNTTFNKSLYIGGGGGGGNNFTTTEQNTGQTAGAPQGIYIYSNNGFSNSGVNPLTSYWGQGGSTNGDGIQACCFKSGSGDASSPTNYWNFVGGGGGGGAGFSDGTTSGNAAGGNGGGGANGCVLVWWNNTLTPTSS